MCQKLSMYGMYGTLLAFSVHHTVSFLYTVQLFFEQCTISFLLYVHQKASSVQRIGIASNILAIH